MKEIRDKIDSIDAQVQELLMARMDCSRDIVQAKIASGDTSIYRADREAEILERLGGSVPQDRRAEYLAVVRKVMEASRSYQYDLLFDQEDDGVDCIDGHERLEDAGSGVKVALSRPDTPYALAMVLGMIADSGFSVAGVKQLDEAALEDACSYELTILGDPLQRPLRKLLFQLSRECLELKVLETVR